MMIFPPIEPDEDFRVSWHVGQHFCIFRQPLRVAPDNDNQSEGWPRLATDLPQGEAHPVQQELFT